jgi:plasmid stabilization system protein ParE
VKWSVVLRSRAERDIEEAYRWYELQQTGLGNQFLDEIGIALRILKEDADRFPLYVRGFRRKILTRFPYNLFFVIERIEVTVARVLHAKQDHSRRLR